MHRTCNVGSRSASASFANTFHRCMPDLNFRCNEVPVSNSYHHVLQPTRCLRRTRSAHQNPDTLHPSRDGNNWKQVSVHRASCYSCLDQSSNVRQMPIYMLCMVLQGCKATICMPVTTPEIKVEAVRRMGGLVDLVGESYSETQAYAQVPLFTRSL